MGGTESSKKSIGKLILMTIPFIVLVTFYSILISKNDKNLQIVGAIISGLFLLGNIYYIIKNRHFMKKSQRMIQKKEVSFVRKSPLEVYLLHEIWNHKKVRVGKGHIASDLLYEIREGTLLFDGKYLTISPSLNLEQSDIVRRYLIETVFLDPLSYQQSAELKLEKLKKMQYENAKEALIEVKNNISTNIQNGEQIRNLTISLKKKYFKEVENESSAPLTILSMLVAILNMVEASSFFKTATIENFYIPASLALLLVGTVTSKYRESVFLREERAEEVGEVLNYIQTLSHRELTMNDRVYLCSLGLIKKEEQDEIIQIFHIE